MRAFYLLVLMVVVTALAVFAWQNQEAATLHYLDRTVTLPLAALIGAVYLLGMLSGWTVVGILRRSLERATERREP
jgi:uncharacterized integral membrane protein